MQTETWIGVGASICTGMAMLPQLIKIYQEKKPADISYLMMAILMAGLLLWIWYGTKKSDWIIIISNAVSFIINSSIVLLNLLYRERKMSRNSLCTPGVLRSGPRVCRYKTPGSGYTRLRAHGRNITGLSIYKTVRCFVLQKKIIVHTKNGKHVTMKSWV